MASVLIGLAPLRQEPNSAPPAGAHPKVTLAAGNVSVTFDVTSRENDFDDLATRWEEVDRPGMRPLLVKAADQLAKLRISTVIGLPVDVPITEQLNRLLALGRGDRDVALGYSSGGFTVSRAGWKLTSLSWRTLRRRTITNEITRARVELILTESSDPERADTVPGGGGLKPAAQAASAGPADEKARLEAAPRRYTVRDGETLWDIAVANYGDGNAMGKIAQANGIRDPRRVSPGMTLTLP